MCVRACVCLFVIVRVYVYACMRTCVRECMCLCVYVRVCTGACVCGSWFDDRVDVI